MCEQCLTKAEIILKDALPGYTLMQARIGSTDWPVGWYGLVQQNDPDFVFPGPLTLDPWAGLSDAEIAAREDDNDYAAYQAVVATLNPPLNSMPAVMGYELVMACRLAGYDIKRDGSEIAYWLMHHLAKSVRDAQQAGCES